MGMAGEAMMAMGGIGEMSDVMKMGRGRERDGE
jgi:hypothetical protein